MGMISKDSNSCNQVHFQEWDIENHHKESPRPPPAWERKPGRCVYGRQMEFIGLWSANQLSSPGKKEKEQGDTLPFVRSRHLGHVAFDLPALFLPSGHPASGCTAQLQHRCSTLKASYFPKDTHTHTHTHRSQSDRNATTEVSAEGESTNDTWWAGGAGRDHKVNLAVMGWYLRAEILRPQ